jgi:hypothetical protein
MTRVYKTRDGYEIKKETGELYAIIKSHVTKKLVVRYIGKFSSSWAASGRLLKAIPNEIKTIFFNIQRTK